MFEIPPPPGKPKAGEFAIDPSHHLAPTIGFWLMDNSANEIVNYVDGLAIAANSPPEDTFAGDGRCLNFTHNSNQYFDTKISDSRVQQDYTMAVIFTPSTAPVSQDNARTIIGFNTKGQVLWDHSGNEPRSFAWNNAGWRFLPWSQTRVSARFWYSHVGNLADHQYTKMGNSSRFHR